MNLYFDFTNLLSLIFRRNFFTWLMIEFQMRFEFLFSGTTINRIFYYKFWTYYIFFSLTYDLSQIGHTVGLECLIMWFLILLICVNILLQISQVKVFACLWLAKCVCKIKEIISFSILFQLKMVFTESESLVFIIRSQYLHLLAKGKKRWFILNNFNFSKLYEVFVLITWIFLDWCANEYDLQLIYLVSFLDHSILCSPLRCHA